MMTSNVAKRIANIFCLAVLASSWSHSRGSCRLLNLHIHMVSRELLLHKCVWRLSRSWGLISKQNVAFDCTDDAVLLRVRVVDF